MYIGSFLPPATPAQLNIYTIYILHTVQLFQALESVLFTVYIFYFLLTFKLFTSSSPCTLLLPVPSVHFYFRFPLYTFLLPVRYEHFLLAVHPLIPFFHPVK